MLLRPALNRRSAARLLSLHLAAAMLLFPLHAFAKDQVPDWVRQAAAQKTPEYPARTDAVVLLDEHGYTIGANGAKVEHVRRAVKILRPQGRQYGELFAFFSNGSKLKYVHLWSIGPDGHEYVVPDNEQSEFAVGAGFELYTDARARGGKAPALDTGSIAAIEYEREERPYENDVIWVPSEPIPVLRERMTLALPEGYSYKAAWKGKAATKPVDLEQNRTLWEVSDLPALHLEGVEMAPDEYSLAARLDVFYYAPGSSGPQTLRGDWKDIGLWYEALALDRNKPDAAITAKAQELVAGKTGFRDRVEAIANFVQSDIRYVAIEIGIGGNQPHPASDIFRARYGDCKDKATLLSAMLQAVGIHSTWVMVDTHRGVIAQGSPSLAGNHMVGAIQLPADYKPDGMYSIVKTDAGKRFLIFDPTWEKTPFGHIEHELQGSDALLVDGADSQVIHIPVLDPQQNLVERKSSFKLDADGSIAGSVHEQRSGDIASEPRYVFGMADGRKQQQFLDRATAQDLLSFQISDVKLGNVRDLSKDLTVDYDLKAEHFARQTGPLLMVRPRVVGHESFPIDRPGPHSGPRGRDVSIDMGSTRIVQDDCSIALPAGYAVDELPRNMDFDLGFASYHSKVTAEGNTLHYSRTYTVREITLPADRYADLEKLSRIIATDEGSSAVLKRTN